MNKLLVYLALFAGQFNTLQDKPVVRLQPHLNAIPVEFGGELVELKDAPPEVRLPPPRILDSHGHPWAIAVRNLGPGTVTVVGQGQLHVEVPAGKTVNIKSTNAGYTSGR